jgi:predicted aldo/keto reductase-like oxidoreductase
MTDTIVKAINELDFSYVNLHWYYIFQENWPAIEAAAEHDMGVFIISPNDKGGMLYKPSEKLVELCAPLHPMVFNGLFCLSRPEVHTLSCGVSRPSDLNAHLETVEQLEDAAALAGPIAERMDKVLEEACGREWLDTWREGLPYFQESPGNINMWVMLRLWNLVKAFDMTGYASMRYNLLGAGAHWHPGEKANDLDKMDLSESLRNSPNAAVIPEKLQELHSLVAGEDAARLQKN